MAYSKLGTSTGILKVTEPELRSNMKYTRLEDTEQIENYKEIVHQSPGGRQSDSVNELQAAQCPSVDRDMDDINGKSQPQCAGNPPELVSSAANKAAQTSVELSGFVKEDDIDPFTYYPPFTKWDYIKVATSINCAVYDQSVFKFHNFVKQ